MDFTKIRAFFSESSEYAPLRRWIVRIVIALIALFLSVWALSAPLSRQFFLNGLMIGGVYAIFAVGYTLIFSILRIINFAHGAIFALGAYFAYLLTGEITKPNGLLNEFSLGFALPFPVAVLIGGILAGLVSVLIERIAFRPLRAKGADPLLTLVSSLGVATAVVNIISMLFRNEPYAYPNPLGSLPTLINLGTDSAPFRIGTVPLIIFITSMVLVALLTILINYTKTGKALRAVAEDTTTSSLLGINTNHLIRLTFFLSGAIGGIAGSLVGLRFGITGPTFGINYGLKGLAVIVLGGMGSIPGAVAGGLVIGMSEAFVPTNLVAFKDAIAFAVLFGVLLVRPQGLLGRAFIQKV